MLLVMLSSKAASQYIYTSLLVTFLPPGGNYEHFHLVWQAYPSMWFGKYLSVVTRRYSHVHNQLFSLW